MKLEELKRWQRAYIKSYIKRLNDVIIDEDDIRSLHDEFNEFAADNNLPAWNQLIKDEYYLLQNKLLNT